MLTFGLAPYNLYMYIHNIRVSIGFFLRCIPPQNQENHLKDFIEVLMSCCAIYSVIAAKISKLEYLHFVGIPLVLGIAVY